MSGAFSVVVAAAAVAGVVHAAGQIRPVRQRARLSAEDVARWNVDLIVVETLSRRIPSIVHERGMYKFKENLSVMDKKSQKAYMRTVKMSLEFFVSTV